MGGWGCWQLMICTMPIQYPTYPPQTTCSKPLPHPSVPYRCSRCSGLAWRRLVGAKDSGARGVFFLLFPFIYPIMLLVSPVGKENGSRERAVIIMKRGSSSKLLVKMDSSKFPTTSALEQGNKPTASCFKALVNSSHII